MDMNDTKNGIELLPRLFSSQEEDRVLQIVDRHLAQNGDALSIVNDLSKGMEAVGELYKNDEYALAELVYAGEIFKEVMKRVKPRLAAGGDAYRGACIMGTVEGDIHDLREVLIELVGDDLAQIGRVELLVPLLDVASLLNGAYDSSISARPSNAFIFQRFYQRCLIISRWRLCKMLLSFYVNYRQLLTHLHWRQLLLARCNRPDFGEAVENQPAPP
jgi:hypothetical protein